jgi:ABC-type nitrate/sulfonate/bicarbonate transport system permease component
VRISIHALDRALAATGPQSSAAFATAIRGALDAPSFDRTRKPRRRVSPTAVATRLLGRTLGWLRAPATYRRLLGYALFFGAWYLAVDVLALPRFDKLPGISQVVGEWLSTNPTYGLSLHTPVYFAHIWSSLSRIALAFLLATVLGVPTGLALGASATFREYVFPVFELLRPIPIPAWVPLAIVAFSGAETPIVFVSFLGSFFATALNTLVGVRSIEPKYLLAAQCLGARPGQLFRHVILPASVPFIVTGLQISIGLAWFSLAAAEMISGQFGLGYLINTSYTMVQYPTIVIGMLTLGILGFATSACVRLAGERFMAWRARELSLEIP